MEENIILPMYSVSYGETYKWIKYKNRQFSEFAMVNVIQNKAILEENCPEFIKQFCLHNAIKSTI